MPDLNFDSRNTLYATHGLHAYAAKCPPQLARYGLRYYSRPDDTVLDPIKPSAKSREKVEKGIREDKELSNKLAAQGGTTLTVKAKDKDHDYYLRDRKLELTFSEDMLREFLDKADESISDARDYFFQSIGCGQV